MLPAANNPRMRARGLRLVSQILLAVQVLSLGHLLSVRHITCPEHGDIIHVEHSAGALSEMLTTGTVALVQHSVAAVEPTAGAEHDHCLVCVDTHRRCLLTGPAQAFAQPVLVVDVVHATPTSLVTPIDLILLSPKNSPPTA